MNSLSVMILFPDGAGLLGPGDMQEIGFDPYRVPSALSVGTAHRKAELSASEFVEPLYSLVGADQVPESGQRLS
jgi:hypothetical protein